jgi:hypothetical protein
MAPSIKKKTHRIRVASREIRGKGKAAAAVAAAVAVVCQGADAGRVVTPGAASEMPLVAAAAASACSSRTRSASRVPLVASLLAECLAGPANCVHDSHSVRRARRGRGEGRRPAVIDMRVVRQEPSDSLPRTSRTRKPLPSAGVPMPATILSPLPRP